MKLNLFFLIMVLGVLSVSVQGQVTIGSVETPEKAALLDLKTQSPDADNATTNKGGLLLPRVKLVNPLTLEPFIVNATADEKHSHTGLTVYNVTHDETAGLESGHYYWNGLMWVKMVTSLPAGGTVNMRNLLTTTTSAGVAGPSGDGGANLDFGNITVAEDGAYAFSFRLYAIINGATAVNQRGVYYLRVLVNGVLADAAEINLYSMAASGGTACTASVTLGVNASAGDVITFRFAYNTNYPRSMTLMAAPVGDPLGANRTSMIWWKL